MRKMAMALAVLTVIVLGYLMLWPTELDPAAYRPPPAPAMTGPLAPNERLGAAELIADGRLPGPEDIAFDAAGRLHTGVADGRILQVSPAGEVTELADTGGRPLGLAFAPDGRLFVADGERGLLTVERDGTVRAALTEAGGVALGFADDLAISAGGVVYFSDASSRFGMSELRLDLLEARPHGRLIRYDPATGEARVLLDDLYFANGVALGPNERFVAVNETYRYRVRRYWLKGPRAGRDDVLIDNLPGFPDNLSWDPERRRFWIAMYTVRNALVDTLHPYPLAKAMLARLPSALWPSAAQYGLVLAVDADGRLRDSLHDPDGRHVTTVTSVQAQGEWLYLGSLEADHLARLPVPSQPDSPTVGGSTPQPGA